MTQDGGTPLIMAAGGGHEEAVKLLLAANANMDVIDKVNRLDVFI